MALTTPYLKQLLFCSILLPASLTLIAQAEIQNPGSAAGTYWKVRGNANTTASTAAIGATVNNNFIGTTNTEAFVLAANGMERVRLDGSNFLIGIGQVAPQYAIDLKVNPDAVNPCGRNGLRILHPAYSNACNNGLFLGITGDNPDNAMLWNMSGSGSNAEYLSIGLNNPSVATNEVIRIVSHAVNINSPVNTEAVLNLMDNSTTKMHGIMVSYAGNAPGTRGTFFGLSSSGLNDDALIWNYRPNAILLGTNNAQRVEISSAGNVGINVTGSPSYLLDVQGNNGVNPMRVRGVLTGATADSLLTINSSGVVRRMKASDMFAATSTDWSLTGNASTIDGTNFIGTTDNVPFTIKVNNQQAGRLDPLLSNTLYGYWAGRDNSSGTQNTALGINALLSNSTGVKNTALGTSALESNTGDGNTAIGYNTLAANSTGIYNTALGYNANVGSGGLTNAAAIGSAAMVTASNSLVLGSINGVNGGTANVNVGIGTTSPGYALDVLSALFHTGNFINSATSTDNIGVYGACNNTPYYGYGGLFEGGYIGVYGNSSIAGTGTRYGVYGSAANGVTNYAGYFAGNANVSGTLSKGAGAFKIDHPLDPENKYLWHSFVESPDMMNIYNGNIITDNKGEATITLPDYFEALNRDFRYQLTAIGQQANAWIVKEVNNNNFRIKTDKPNVKISWQLTGVRHDKYADAHRIPNEVTKEPENKGKYIHWQEWGQTEEKSIDFEVVNHKPKGK